MSQVNLIKKITLKTIGAQPAPNSIDVTTDLCAVYGRADRMELGSTTFGEYVKFKGQFEAQNIATGEIFQSGELIVPEIVSDLITGAMEANEGQAVEFAFIITAIADKKEGGQGRGYQFTAKPLIEEQKSDPLAMLRAKVTSSVPVIEAPSENESE